ncbi:MAG TPA: hypothetical protein VKX49_17710 [Bryobacteraceae bacterium]|nr:hypothetical protein [Bryobacteraceae bacterium]
MRWKFRRQLTGHPLDSPVLRNNLSGWVGIEDHNRATALSIASLGRLCVAGNTGVQTIEFVDASTGAPLAGLRYR